MYSHIVQLTKKQYYVQKKFEIFHSNLINFNND